MQENFLIEELKYIPMGEHTPVFTRPYIVSVSGDAVENLIDRTYGAGKGIITTNDVASLTGQFIQPSAVGEHSVINQNWVTEPKFIFILKVRVVDFMGVTTVSYIHGFTNYNGISMQGTADPQMLHQINGIIETSLYEIPTPMGVIRKEKLYKVYSVHSGNQSTLEYYTQRPIDILENVQLTAASDSMREVGNTVDFMNVSSIINEFTGNVVSSKASNNIGTEYLTDILNAGVAEQKSRDIFVSSYEVKDDSAKGTKILEPSINDNRFVKYMSKVMQMQIVGNTFEFATLTFIDPTIASRFLLINITKGYNTLTAHTPEVGEYWHGQDPVTVKAYGLIESMVAMATRYGLGKVFFYATNMNDPTGAFEIAVTSVNSFISIPDDELVFLVELFKNKVVADILIGETSGGVIPIFLEMYVDLMGTSKIRLQYAGFPDTWYTIPTSANSLFSPITTSDYNNLDTSSRKFGALIDTVSATSPNSNQFL